MLKTEADIGGAVLPPRGLAQQSQWHFSLLDSMYSGQAGCAGQTSEAAHRGFCSNCCSGYYGTGHVAMLRALPALSNARPRGAQVVPAICRAGNYTPAPQPLEFFLWTHRKHHLLLQKKITAFGRVTEGPSTLQMTLKCPWRSWVILGHIFLFSVAFVVAVPQASHP